MSFIENNKRTFHRYILLLSLIGNLFCIFNSYSLGLKNEYDTPFLLRLVTRRTHAHVEIKIQTGNVKVLSSSFVDVKNLSNRILILYR